MPAGMMTEEMEELGTITVCVGCKPNRKTDTKKAEQQSPSFSINATFIMLKVFYSMTAFQQDKKQDNEFFTQA